VITTLNHLDFEKNNNKREGGRTHRDTYTDTEIGKRKEETKKKKEKTEHWEKRKKKAQRKEKDGLLACFYFFSLIF